MMMMMTSTTALRPHGSIPSWWQIDCTRIDWTQAVKLGIIIRGFNWSDLPALTADALDSEKN